MRYYLDTEFDETPERVVLISLALCAEDGRELYLINREVDAADCNVWVRENVMPRLHDVDAPHGVMLRSLHWFARQIEEFVDDGDDSPEFLGYYCAYDWFLFCRLWGGMLAMPARFPKLCVDLKQLANTMRPGVRFKQYVSPETPEHNALADARWNLRLHRWISSGASS